MAKKPAADAAAPPAPTFIYDNVPPNPASTPLHFHLGLCMAGAVSAGAYTAGVLDFLIEAMDAWQAAKDARQAVPGHHVHLSALSGASAGGMCAAILLAVLDRDFPPARDPDSCKLNPLWQAWVEQPRIEDLLDLSDRGPGRPLTSLLNVGVLRRIVDGVLAGTPRATRRAWVNPSLPLALSVGNLRGVPYGMVLGGAAETAVQARHRMRMHADWVGFVRGAAQPRFGDMVELGSPSAPDIQAWQDLGLAALASGAFPLALEARLLARSGGDYAKRQVLVPGDGHPCSMHRLPRVAHLSPDWPGRDAPDPYRFLAVDGGVFDNEPLDLCRALLVDKPGQRLVRDGLHVDRSVLMIDPFPDEVGAGPDKPVPLHRLIMPLIDAWKMQCRFGATDIALARAPDVFSRVMIFPSRGSDDHVATGGPLASGGLGAFLGFLHRDFRAHDFQLGRRNCQSFLAKHLALPARNPLFEPRYRATPPTDPYAEARAKVWSDVTKGRSELADFRPVVPLVGDCATPLPLPAWPKGRFDPEALRARIRRRLDAVVQDVLRDSGLGMGWWLVANGVWRAKAGGVEQAAVSAIRGALAQKNLD
ncbi:patatin-like phospholipase family protein [Roseomonas sp. CECT 9278]|uniref:patatin-like phospholipase family protein n=1 Tax=Roseomonas sp. CECT 9278 TaxID=2845823 RepID=UPI001E32FB1C|nr:patatin-like phospholipase family protein [Roseomonas sp. CECT 9278]CAH0225446.1 hypothetical protein ROS9278_02517 [Roseomonas sp. CECT 9278]